MEYKSNHNVVYSCKYHVVWCPKYRHSVLINGVDVRLKELIKETCDSLNVEIIEMEIMPDHVYLLTPKVAMDGFRSSAASRGMNEASR